MEKKSRKEFKELSEEQLQEVTGGGKIHQIMICVTSVTDNPCPGKRLDSQCHCID